MHPAVTLIGLGLLAVLIAVGWVVKSRRDDAKERQQIKAYGDMVDRIFTEPLREQTAGKKRDDS